MSIEKVCEMLRVDVMGQRLSPSTDGFGTIASQADNFNDRVDELLDSDHDFAPLDVRDGGLVDAVRLQQSATIDLATMRLQKALGLADERSRLVQDWRAQFLKVLEPAKKEAEAAIQKAEAALRSIGFSPSCCPVPPGVDSDEGNSIRWSHLVRLTPSVLAANARLQELSECEHNLAILVNSAKDVRQQVEQELRAFVDRVRSSMLVSA